MVAVLQPWSTSEPGKLTPPPQLNNPMTAVILSRAKGTYCRPQPLIWIVRDGFQFEYAVNQPISAIESRLAQVDQLERFLFSQTNDSRKHTRKTLDDAYDGIGLTRLHGRGALNELLVSGRVVEVALQKKEKQGGKKSFFCPVDLAASFGEVEGKTEVAGDYLADPSTSPPPYRELNGGEVAAPL